MKNQSNLIPVSSRTSDELREMTRKGGIKSGESRRKKKLLRELLDAALDTTMRDKDGGMILNPNTGKRMTQREAGMVKLARKFANGDAKAIEQTARLLGEWEETMNINADVSTQSDVVMGFDPMAAIREMYGKEGGDE